MNMMNRPKILFRSHHRISLVIAVVLLLIFSLILKMQLLALFSAILLIFLVYPSVFNQLLQYIKSLKIGNVHIFFQSTVTALSSEQNIENGKIRTLENDLLSSANFLLAKGENAGAIDKYKELIEKDDKNINAYINLGVAYLRLYEKVKESFLLEESIYASQKAIQLAGNGYRSRINLGRAYLYKGDYQKAYDLYHRADEKSKKSDETGETWIMVKYFKVISIISLLETMYSHDSKFSELFTEAEKALMECESILRNRGYAENDFELLNQAREKLYKIRNK